VAKKVSMQTETIDKLFLELSQVSKAMPAREIAIMEKVIAITQAVEPFAAIVRNSEGRIPTEKLSLADWHELSKAFISTKEFIEKKKGKR
jgi:hypothetical protein